MSTDCYWVQDGVGKETGCVCVLGRSQLTQSLTYVARSRVMMQGRHRFAIGQVCSQGIHNDATVVIAVAVVVDAVVGVTVTECMATVVDVAIAQIQMLIEAVTCVAVRNERFRRFGTAHATQIALGHAAITCARDTHHIQRERVQQVEMVVGGNGNGAIYIVERECVRAWGNGKRDRFVLVLVIDVIVIPV